MEPFNRKKYSFTQLYVCPYIPLLRTRAQTTLLIRTYTLPAPHTHHALKHSHIQKYAPKHIAKLTKFNQSPTHAHSHTLLFITQVKTHSFTQSPNYSSICSFIHFHSHYIRLQHTIHSYASSSAPMSRVSHSLCSFIRSLSRCITPHLPSTRSLSPCSIPSSPPSSPRGSLSVAASLFSMASVAWRKSTIYLYR